MAGESEVISVIDMGRLVHVLRREKVYESSTQYRGGRYRYPFRERKIKGRRFSEEQLQVILNLTTAEMDEYEQAYTTEIAPTWSQGKVRDAVIAFARKEGRWPTKKDFGPAAGHGLPSHSTWHREGGPASLDAWLQTDKQAKKLSPQLLLTIRNVTVRNVAIENAGGIEKLIKRGGATQVAKDEYGVLWELPAEPETTESRQLWVEVTNSTETHGKREHFFLRVPPTGIATPKQAVEWTFGIELNTLEEFAAQT